MVWTKCAARGGGWAQSILRDDNDTSVKSSSSAAQLHTPLLLCCTVPKLGGGTVHFADVNPGRILGWVVGIPLQETDEGRIGLSASLFQESLP